MAIRQSIMKNCKEMAFLIVGVWVDNNKGSNLQANIKEARHQAEVSRPNVGGFTC